MFYFLDNPPRLGRPQHPDRPQPGLQNLGFRTLQESQRHRVRDVRAEDKGEVFFRVEAVLFLQWRTVMYLSELKSSVLTQHCL